MLSPGLCVVRLVASSSESAISALAALLLAAGKVRPTFEKAALGRERRSPTGLPFPGVAVALPHGEPEHVVAPAIAVASLAEPVLFRQMGSPEVKLAVSLVVMPALSEASQAAGELSKIMQGLQDDALRQEVVQATTNDAMCAALLRHFDR